MLMIAWTPKEWSETRWKCEGFISRMRGECKACTHELQLGALWTFTIWVFV